MSGELPADQRPDDGRSVTFDTQPLAERLEILGAPVVTLDLASDRPVAMIAARLEDVAPDGASTLVTYGLLNLAHRDGSETPEALTPGNTYRVIVKLNDIAQAFPPGHRIRLALATSHWPIAWPSPEAATLTVGLAGYSLVLPVREPAALDDTLADFPPPEQAEAEPVEISKEGGRNRTIAEDPMTGAVTVSVHRERSSYRLPGIDLSFKAGTVEHYRIVDGDPSATSVEIETSWQLTRGDWSTRTDLRTEITCTAKSFEVSASLIARESDAQVAERHWASTVPRRLV